MICIAGGSVYRFFPRDAMDYIARTVLSKDVSPPLVCHTPVLCQNR